MDGKPSTQADGGENYPRLVRRRVVQLLLLAIAVGAAAYARMAIGPLQESMRTALVLSDNQMALLQGPAMAVPFVLASIPLGLVIDRRSRVRIFLLFGIITVAGSIFTLLASNYAMLVIARALVGFTTLAINPVAISLLADHYLPAQRGRATMVVVFGQVAGTSGAFALGGALAAAFPGPDGWRWALAGVTVPLIAMNLLILAMREPPRTGVALSNPSLRQVRTHLWGYRLILGPLLAGIVLIDIAFGAGLVWTAPAFSRAFQLPADQVGAAIAAALLVGGIVGPLLGGTLADLCQRTGGPRRTLTMLCGLALLSAPAGLYPLMPGIVPATVLFVLFKILVSAKSVMGLTLFTVVIPNELRGLSVGLLMATAIFFTSGVGPLTASLLSGILGGPDMIGTALSIICVTTCLSGAAMFAVGRACFYDADRKLAIGDEGLTGATGV